MVSDRISRLQALAEASPDDPFPRYGLAMEYRNSGQLQRAVKGFLALLEKHPDYLASYLHCGMCLEETGDEQKAAEVYRAGIEVAERQQDLRAKQELEAALSMIL